VTDAHSTPKGGLHNPVRPLRNDCSFPSFTTSEKSNIPIIFELRAQWNHNLCGNSVGSQEDFALAQCLEPETLRLQHGLFTDPIAEKPRSAILLFQAVDYDPLGMSKVPAGEFLNFYFCTNVFKIDPHFTPARNGDERPPTGMGEIKAHRQPVYTHVRD